MSGHGRDRFGTLPSPTRCGGNWPHSESLWRMVPVARPGIGHSVEGVHAVAAALAAGRVERPTVERARLDALQSLLSSARARGVPIDVVDDVRRAATTDAPQGVVATCRAIPIASLEEVVAATTPAAVLVLDHLEDPRNVGALARSAVAAGIGGLVIPDHRAAPL